jgi:uncharacterized protein (DUF488 family)
MKKFDITKTKQVLFIDSDNSIRIIEIEEIEKEDEKRIDIYTLRGHFPVFEEGHASICSNSDVTIEFRSQKKCGKGCCDL